MSKMYYLERVVIGEKVLGKDEYRERLETLYSGLNTFEKYGLTLDMYIEYTKFGPVISGRVLDSFQKYLTVDFINKFPEFKYTSQISSNININRDMLLTHKYLPWDNRKLCKNKYVIDNKFIEDNPDFEYDYNMLACNPSVTIDGIGRKVKLNESSNKYKLLEKILTRGSENTIRELLENNQDLFFDVRSLSVISNFANEKYILDKFGYDKFYSINPLNRKLSLDFIKNTIDTLSYDFHTISITSPHVKELVDLFPLGDWDFHSMIFNRCITEDFIEKYIHNFSTEYLSCYRQLSEEFVSKHKDFKWDIACISRYSDNIKVMYNYVSKENEKLVIHMSLGDITGSYNEERINIFDTKLYERRLTKEFKEELKIYSKCMRNHIKYSYGTQKYEDIKSRYDDIMKGNSNNIIIL